MMDHDDIVNAMVEFCEANWEIFLLEAEKKGYTKEEVVGAIDKLMGQ